MDKHTKVTKNDKDIANDKSNALGCSEKIKETPTRKNVKNEGASYTETNSGEVQDVSKNK